LIEKFDLMALGKSAAVFNPDKLLWLNSHYIHHGDSRMLADRLMPFIVKEGILPADERPDEALLEKMVSALKERSRTLVEMAQATRYFLRDDYPVDEAAKGKFLTPAMEPVIKDLTSRLESLEPFSVPELEKAFATLMEERALKLSKLAQPVRVALTGRTVSPGIFEVIEILGKDRTIARLNQALKAISPAA
jgi:glutamyl-tRNA synthetase